MNATDWISFADKQPERGQDVLLHHEKGFYSARKYGLSDEHWTHWQAIVPPENAFEEWWVHEADCIATREFAKRAFKAGQRAAQKRKP